MVEKEEPIIKTKDTSLIYDLGQTYETNALLNVNIEIYPEEYVIIYGPSGCGKSTLLYCVSGLQKPTSGQVWVNGKEIASLSSEDRVNINRFEIGMIFQAYYLVPSLNVLDNVILPRIFCKGDKLKRRKKAKELLNHFGILDQAKKFPNRLSGGQRQRVSIARSMINDPSIIIADEPVGNLDSKSTKVVMELLDELNKKFKKTIVLVTHDDRFLNYADRVLYMKDGQVVREVQNDKKKLNQEIVETEETQFLGILDRLAKIYPNLPVEQLKAKALTQYLLIDLTPTEVSRLEKVITKRITGEINIEVLEKVLDDSFKVGGVGLYKQTAKDFAQKIDTILSEADFLKHNIQTKELKLSVLEIKVKEMRRYLLDNYHGNKLKEEKIKRLEFFIQSRLEKKVNQKKLKQKLDLAYQKGGVGLNSRTARYFAKELEMVLTQE